MLSMDNFGEDVANAFIFIAVAALLSGVIFGGGIAALLWWWIG